MSDELRDAHELLTTIGQDFDLNTGYLIQQIGRSYKPAVLPRDIPRGLPGNCYDHCAVVAAESYMMRDGEPKYRYVEGWATDPEKQKHAHAWLTDGVHAFDPTWLAINNDTHEEHPMPAEYFGIEIDMHLVLAFLKASDGYKAVIGNRWRAPEAAAAALGVTVKELCL